MTICLWSNVYIRIWTFDCADYKERMGHMEHTDYTDYKDYKVRRDYMETNMDLDYMDLDYMDLVYMDLVYMDYMEANMDSRIAVDMV